MKYVERHITKAVLESYEIFSVIVITGPRQSGKTTFIKNVFADLPYFSMEDLDVRRIALDDPRGFFASYSKGMVLDEVQNTSELLSYIQGIVDSNPDIRFVLSGSSNFSLLKNITQSLAGRSAIFELLPFSYYEIDNKDLSVSELLFSGMYPAVVCAGKNAKLVYKNYTKTYLERDVRDWLSIKNIDLFQKFMRLCASRIGSEFNASEISNELGVAVNTIKSWLSVLSASYVIVMLQPFYENTRKRLTKTPKIYFTDTGLACYLLEIESVAQLQRDKMKGHLFENYVVMESIKHRFNNGDDNNACFYRDSNHVEVDLLLKKEGLLTAIEIKSSSTFHPEFEKGLKSFKSEFGAKVSDFAVVYTGEYENYDRDFKLLNYRNIDKIL